VVPSTRAGRYVKQPTGYRAFIPSPLPPDPPIRLDPPVQSLLSLADQAVGRLDGATNISRRSPNENTPAFGVPAGPLITPCQ